MPQQFLHLIQSMLGCLLLIYMASATVASSMSPRPTKTPIDSGGPDDAAWGTIKKALDTGLDTGIQGLRDDGIKTLPGDPEGQPVPKDDPDGEAFRRRRRQGVGDVPASRRRRRKEKKKPAAKMPTGSKGDHGVVDNADAILDKALQNGAKSIKDDGIETLPRNPEGQPISKDDPDAEASRRRRQGGGDTGASRRRRRSRKNNRVTKKLTDNPVVMENHEGPNAWVPKSNHTGKTPTDGNAIIDKIIDDMSKDLKDSGPLPLPGNPEGQPSIGNEESSRRRRVIKGEEEEDEEEEERKGIY